MLNAFTVDVEDWFHGIPIPGETRRSAERRLRRGMKVLLRMLEDRSLRGTFFFLGPVALEYPQLLRELVNLGHEIGCHGWSHDLLYAMGPERFRCETLDARVLLEGISGRPVTSYRAAYFSITGQSIWALRELVQLGFRCDSSVFPVRNWRYGIPGFEPRPRLVPTGPGPIFEFPLPVVDYAGRSLPATGGAYFRVYPYCVTRAHMTRLERAGLPTVFYIHPWELDPEHPRIAFEWRPHLTHYWNLSSSRAKLEQLLSDFSFAPLGEVMARELREGGTCGRAGG
jgi:polysaccharide deacetylase family protein (PEP-CTERM system associated)